MPDLLLLIRQFWLVFGLGAGDYGITQAIAQKHLQGPFLEHSRRRGRRALKKADVGIYECDDEGEVEGPAFEAEPDVEGGLG